MTDGRAPVARPKGTVASRAVSFSLLVSRRQEIKGSYTKASNIAITLSLLSRSTRMTLRETGMKGMQQRVG